MSESKETIHFCPADNGIDLVDTFAIILGVLTVIGSVFAYFLQRGMERNDAADAKLKEDADLDRDQALSRVRKQLKVLIGPLHRLYKIQMTIVMQYRRQSGMGFGAYNALFDSSKSRNFWQHLWQEEFLLPFIDEPHSFEAVVFRNLVSRRLKPIYSRVRELVLAHMSDLADMPTQEDWLKRYTKEEITSPHTTSMNINVIFDAYTAWALEYDDIVASWARGDFRRMQPSTKVCFFICNDLVDLLYNNAKLKEAKYNKHVSVNINKMQRSSYESLRG